MERKEQLLHQAATQRHQLSQQQVADQEREYADYLKSEQQKLQEKLPEWRDSKVQAGESRAIAEMLIQHGYSQEELGTLADHRALLLARKAMLYDKLIAVRQKQTPPQPQKQAPSGARNNAPTNPRVDDMRRKAMRTHKTEDILAAMLSKES
jgi:hypothetical protein